MLSALATDDDAPGQCPCCFGWYVEADTCGSCDAVICHTCNKAEAYFGWTCKACRQYEVTSYWGDVVWRGRDLRRAWEANRYQVQQHGLHGALTCPESADLHCPEGLTQKELDQLEEWDEVSEPMHLCVRRAA